MFTNKARLKAFAAFFCTLTCTFGLAACDMGRGNTTIQPDGAHNPNYKPDETVHGEFEYELTEDGSGYIFTGIGTVADTSISMPSTYNGLPVIGIADEAFFGNSTLEIVGIGSNVEYIGDNAFYLCSGLTSISIPAKVQSIGKEAFAYCSSLRVASFAEDCQITQIKYATFGNCESLYAVNFPESITVIGTRAFQYCTSLRNLTIGNGIKRIKAEAFRGCTAIANITFGDSLSIIEEKAFQRCTTLKNLILPESLTFIGKNAFYDCNAMESISIPFVGSGTAAKGVPDDEDDDENVTTSYTFSGEFSHIFGTVPSSLKDVTVLGGKTIGTLAFANCKDIERIKLFQGITSIGYSVFNYCYGLNTVILASSLKTVDEGAFYETPALQTVYYEGTEAQWQNVKIQIYNDYLKRATVYFYSESKPATSGKYWHYVYGEPVKW